MLESGAVADISYCQTLARYESALSEPARALLQELLDLPIGQVVQREGLFYFVRVIDPYAGDGFHNRLARGFMQWIWGHAVEFFAPRRAACSGSTDFDAADGPKLQNSAAQGDVVFFRAEEPDAIDAVARFCRTSFLWTERSKGDS